VVLSVLAVRPLRQTLDLLAGERDPIEGLAVLFPLRLVQRTGGEDQIALDDVALDVAARRLAEDSELIPAGAFDPFAAVVAAAKRNEPWRPSNVDKDVDAVIAAQQTLAR
jgi:hypothetical protein